MKNINSFETQVAAVEWMIECVNDECVDNVRFAFLDDAPVMREYEGQRENGCCGCFDETVIVAGRDATVGCNFGH